MKLLVLDVEGTIFRTEVRLEGVELESTIWQGLAQALGPSAVQEEIQSHDRWSQGAYASYLDWMKDTIAIHVRHRLNYTLFRNVIDSAQYNGGIREVVTFAQRLGYEVVFVSGGFRELARRAQIDLNVIHGFAACEYFFDEHGVLTGYNLLPCDFLGKLDFISLLLREYGLGSNDWVFVGDGLNDVPIAEKAPCSVAFQAHHKLQAVSTASIKGFGELAPILEAWK